MPNQGPGSSILFNQPYAVSSPPPFDNDAISMAASMAETTSLAEMPPHEPGTSEMPPHEPGTSQESGEPSEKAKGKRPAKRRLGD